MTFVHVDAGTTGAGLAAGCPTMAVPFFGDQAFWGEMCRRSGVGPAPVPVERLSVEALLEGLAFLARPEVCGSLKPYKPKKSSKDES